MSHCTPETDLESFAAKRDGATVVDVREPAEYAAGHVPGAVLMPMGQLATRMAELDRGTPVYVICASGNRSLAMTDVLRHAGYDATSVAGGTTGWVRSGRPVEEGLR
jgi:rhodanese-related sulfurtransferase